jgi:Ca-activated chloride channel family protein
VYDDSVDVLQRSTNAIPEAKRRALSALHDIGPRGMTDLSSGWLRGSAEIAEHLNEEGIARALLLTDGLANRGITERPMLAHHAGELRKRGVATSTFGVGADFDERLLRDMAHEGGGNFYFIENPAQIPDLLTSELGEALEVVARRAALEIVLPRGARAEVLNRFRFAQTPGGNELRVELGDLSSGQEVRAVIRVQFAPDEAGQRATMRIAMTADGAADLRADGMMTWTYATHAENDVQSRDAEVDREVGTLYAARARAEATEANRHGDFDRARRVLERTADRIASYAGQDPVLRQLVRELRAQVPEFSQERMSPIALKSAMFAAEATGKGRNYDGKARRRP